jgi:hypothetical protein
MFNVGTLLLAGTYTPGTGMKLRSPVNFDLAMIDQISPAAQAGLRDFRRRGVMRERHPAACAIRWANEKRTYLVRFLVR